MAKDVAASLALASKMAGLPNPWNETGRAKVTQTSRVQKTKDQSAVTKTAGQTRSAAPKGVPRPTAGVQGTGQGLTPTASMQGIGTAPGAPTAAPQDVGNETLKGTPTVKMGAKATNIPHPGHPGMSTTMPQDAKNKVDYTRGKEGN